MAGLLDFLSGSYGGGGLLSGLMYPSPLLQPQEQPLQTIYSPDGMPIFTPQSEAPSPFGLPPNFNPADYAPKSPFTAGAAPAPFAPSFSAGPTIAPPQQPASQPADQPSLPPVDFPQNTIGVGGYQMPRVGDASNFIPEQVNTPPNAQPAQGLTPPSPSQPQTLPPALGGGGSSLGRIFNPDGLVARLTGNDSRSIAQQNAKAQYDALVPLVGSQKAMLAVLNPEAGKTILAQALEKKNYGFIKGDNGEVIATDPLQGTAKSVYGGGAGSSNGVAGPDGKIIPYPEGLDSAGRKAFANHIATINADAATGKMTESQGKAAGFATRMNQALPIIQKYQGQGQSAFGKISEKAPFGGAYLQSEEYQQYASAKQSFINAHLRKDSGASIHDPEYVRAEKELFPQPGEGPEAVKQKAARRAAIAEATQREAGPAFRQPSSATTLPSGWSVSVR